MNLYRRIRYLFLALPLVALPGLVRGQTLPTYAGIYAQPPSPNNGTTLAKHDIHHISSAFANPFVVGVMLQSTWDQIEPLPPGVDFPVSATGEFFTVTLPGIGPGGAGVAISCLDPGAQASPTTNGVDYHNYCWDSVDEQLEAIGSQGRSSPYTLMLPDGSKSWTVPALSIGIDINAGFHSPAWLSSQPMTVNTNLTSGSGAGIEVNFPSAVTSGTYADLGTVSCTTFAAATGAVVTGTPCATAGQTTFTTWQGFVGGNANTDNQGSCAMVKLPVPFSLTSPYVAPHAQLYVDMLAALQYHITTDMGISASKITVVKLGASLDGQDAELTMLGGNSSGSAAYQFVYPTEADGSSYNTSSGTNTCPVTLPAGGATTYYNSVWQGTYGYNPRYVELTFEYIANAVGALFNGRPANQQTLLNLDVHTDEKTTFPFIPFQETNTNTNTIYTNSTYDWQADGPRVQDDIVFCDLIGTWSNGNTVTLTAFWPQTPPYTMTAGPYWAGFYGSTTDHCLNGMRPDNHQPLTYSLPHGYQWGIEQDGLEPVTATSIPGVDSQAYATYGLELSWGMNGGGDHGGALCGNGSSTSDGSCSSATAQTTICGTDPAGTPQTCSYLLEQMLQSGLYKYGGTPPYSATNPTGQLYILSTLDMCNPFLWQGLAAVNSQITTQTLTTINLGQIGGTWNDFSTNTGHFDMTGAYTQ